MKFPYMKFYPRDWMSDSELRMASIAARGFWFECLCLMHSGKRYGYLELPNGTPIDRPMLSRLIGTYKGQTDEMCDELENLGIPSVDEETGVWYCRRMVKDDHKRKACSNAGKRGGGNPSLKSEEETRNQKPETRNHISIKGTYKGGLYTSEFEEFWKIYPRKTGKVAAFKSFRSAKKKTTVDVIMKSVEEQKTWDQWTKDEGRYIPHPATWLNQGRWDDEPPQAPEKERLVFK